MAAGSPFKREALLKKLFMLLAVVAAVGTAQAKQKRTENKSMDTQTKKEELATFAGGCFWCMQPPYDKLKGVLSTVVGYAGGNKKNPTYEEVSAGGTGHTESIQIKFDPSQVTYGQILDVFWRQIDPLTPNAQFCDHGDQYRSAIFYHSEEQRKLARESEENLEKSGRFGAKKIVTEITAAGDFWPAEDYHQAYYKKNPIRYKFYRFNCGRDQYLEKIWGKSDH